MKYLFFVGSFFPAQEGGPDNSLYWLSRQLVNDNKDVTVITFKKGLDKKKISLYSIKFNKVSHINGVKVYFFDYPFFRIFSFKFYFWVFKNIKKYSIININSFFFFQSILIKILLSFLNKNYFITTRGELELGALKFASIKKKIYLIFFKIFIKKPLFILSTSIQEKKFNKKVLGEKFKYENFKNYYFNENKNINVINNLNKKNLLYLGRLHPKKGIENLIIAFNNLNSFQRKNNKLFIAGKGDKAYTKKLISLTKSLNNNNIEFIGHIEFNKKTKLISESKYVILPSFSENFGLVVIESLTESTPVISSKYTPWKILKKKNAGFYTDNNIGELSKTLINAFDMDNLKYKQMCSAATRLSKFYLINNNIEKFYYIISKYYE